MASAFFILFFLGILGLIFHYFFFSSSSQVFGKVIPGIKTQEKVIALTFDDGPQEPYTFQIVNLLNGYGIKGTFFQIGKNIEQYPQLTRQIFKEGHLIGNHLYNHHFFNGFRPTLFEKEIRKTQEIIYKIAGKRPRFFRPPWLFRGPWTFKVLQKYNLITITGTFGAFFEPYQPNPSMMAAETIMKTRPGSILIFHDGCESPGAKRKATVKAVEIIIPKLLNKGYRCVSLSELLGIDSYQ